MMKLRFLVGLPLVLSLFYGCGSAPLPRADEQMTTLFSYFATAEEASDADIIPRVDELNTLLLETYAGAYDPIPESEIPDLIAHREYPLIDLLRGGVELLAHPENEDTAGALVARPISTDYEDHVQLMVNGNWVDLFYLLYQSYDRTFTTGEDAAFLAGTSNLARADNHVVNAPNRGVVFTYDTESVFRRVRGVNSANGEALLHWEYMIGEADRTQGGYNAYLRYLVNLQIALPIDGTRSFRLSASWSEAGGNVFVFSAGANSGDIGDGIRDVFLTLEEYLASH